MRNEINYQRWEAAEERLLKSVAASRVGLKRTCDTVEIEKLKHLFCGGRCVLGVGTTATTRRKRRDQNIHRFYLDFYLSAQHFFFFCCVLRVGFTALIQFGWDIHLTADIYNFFFRVCRPPSSDGKKIERKFFVRSWNKLKFNLKPKWIQKSWDFFFACWVSRASGSLLDNLEWSKNESSNFFFSLWRRFALAWMKFNTL